MIRAVVFDLFGTLVYEFPRADWDAWLDTAAAAVEVDPDAFHAAWASDDLVEGRRAFAERRPAEFEGR